MADSFITASSEILIPESLLIYNAKVLASLWRYVDMAGGREWRRSDPENFLLPDPRYQRIGNRFVEDAHIGAKWTCLHLMVFGL